MFAFCSHPLVSKLNRILWVLPLLAVVFIYGKTLHYGFVWDDRVVIENQLSAFQSIGDIFFPGDQVHGMSQRFYRPVVYFSYVMDYRVWGNDPFGFHLTNFLMHLINTVLVFYVASAFWTKPAQGDWWGFWVSLLFAVHPGHVESVAWIAGRGDLLAALGLLGSIYFFIGYLKIHSRVSLFFSAFFYLFSILSKETTLAFFLLYPVIQYVYRRHRGSFREYGLAFMPIVGSVLLWGILRFLTKGDIAASETFPWPSLSTLLQEGWFASGYYLKLLFLPIHLSAFPQLPHSVEFFIWAFLAFSLTVGTLWWTWKKREGTALLYTGWWWISLSPALLIAAAWPLAPLAERYFYIPSVGGLFLAVYFLSLYSDEPRKVIWITSALLISVFAWSYFATNRTVVWKDDLNFWQVTVQDIPERWGGHQNLALAYSALDRFDEAEKAFHKALEQAQGDEEKQITLTSMGIDALKQKKYEQAKDFLTRALQFNEGSAYLNYNLGVLHQVDPDTFDITSEIPRLKKALRFFERAQELNPFYVEAYFAAGSLKRVLGDEAGAQKNFEKVIQLTHRNSRDSIQAHRQLALMAFARANRLVRTGKKDEALEAYREALSYDPEFPEAHYEYANQMVSKGRIDQALEHFRAAVAHREDFAEAYYPLGRLLADQGRVSEAIEAYEKFLTYWKGDERFRSAVRDQMTRLKGQR